MRYSIEYSPEAEGHLRALSARERVLVLDAVDRHLSTQPGVETRNRKKLLPNPVAPWELRIRNLRAFYDIMDHLDLPRVEVLAVGIKRGNKLFIGGNVVELKSENN